MPARGRERAQRASGVGMVENGDEANKVVLVLSFILGECGISGLS